MTVTIIGDFLKMKQFGPLVNTLIYLNDEDLKKLSFVYAKNREEMEKNYEKYKELRKIGRKTNQKSFDPTYLSYYKMISELNSFIDSLSIPVNHLSEKERKYDDFLKNESWLDKKCKSDIENVILAIESAEKFGNETMTAIMMKSRHSYTIIHILETLMSVYQEKDFVIKMLPKKTLAFLIGQDDHYMLILWIYKIFGLEFIFELMKYLDPVKFMTLFLGNTLIFSRRVCNICESYSENNDSIFALDDIIEEGKDIKELVYKLQNEYPFVHEMEYSSDNGKISFLDICKNIDISLSELYFMFSDE